MNDEQIERHIECHNTLATYINKVAPLVIARLAEGFKVKADGSLYKKDHEDIKAILTNDLNIRAYLQVSAYTMYLETSKNYPTGDFGCSYIKRSIHVGEGVIKLEDRKPVEFTPLPIRTGDWYKETLATYQAKEEQARELRSELFQLKWDLDL